MAQSHDAKKDVKKKAQKTLKEKRLAKKMKKAGSAIRVKRTVRIKEVVDDPVPTPQFGGPFN